MSQHKNGSPSTWLSRTVSGAMSASPANVFWGGSGGGFIIKYPGAAAGYSLRKLGKGPVVRLRRASDNAESDFTAGDVVAGAAGSELITNGDFSSGLTGWTADSNWTESGGQAVSDGSVSFGYVSQDGVISDQAGVYYLITFDIVACSNFSGAGTLIDSASVKSFSSQWQISSTGTYSVLFKTIGGNDAFRFWTGSGVTMTIDNVSCKPYTPSAAELWAANDKTQMHRQGTESAFCTTWYDQSGNGVDATQAVSTAQPLLIRAGVTATVNGKAALDFDGTDDYLQTDTGSLLGTAWATFSVFDSPANGSYEGLFESVNSGAANKRISFYSTATVSDSSQYNPENLGDNFGTLLDPWTARQYLLTHELSGDTVTPYSSGVIQNAVTNAAQIPGDTSGLNKTRIGRQTIGDLYHSSGIQELILYPSDQSANREPIEENISKAWCIPYPTMDLVGDCRAPEMAAGYSLRDLGGGGNVVRLRRASDNAEQDFTAAEIEAGTAGAELLPDPNFSDTANWVKGVGWTVSGNQAVCDGTQIGLSKVTDVIPVMPADGDIGIITITIDACSDFSNAGIVFAVGSIQSFVSIGITTTGTYTLSFEWLGGSSNCGFGANAGVTMTASHVSYKPYTESAAEAWVSNSKTRARGQTQQSAFCTTWYDQSGSGVDATQAVSTAQPLLIRAGVTHTENGKAALSFDGVDDYLETQSFNSNQPISVFTVQRFDAAGDGANTYLWAMNGNDVNVIANFANRYQIAAGNNCRADVSLYSNDQELFSVMFDSVSSNLYINGLDGQLESNDAGTNGLTAPIRIGGSNIAPNNGMWGEIQEFIIYASDQSANRTIIETNINNHYGIYGATTGGEVLTMSVGSSGAGVLVTAGTVTLTEGVDFNTTTSGGTGLVIDVTTDTSTVTGVVVNDGGTGYEAGDEITMTTAECDAAFGGSWVAGAVLDIDTVS